MLDSKTLVMRQWVSIKNEMTSLSLAACLIYICAFVKGTTLRVGIAVDDETLKSFV